ncbi:MAG: hypothetical protein PVJ64_04165 [Gemmatimonadales bacterium]|jgi:hypothetical protein
MTVQKKDKTGIVFAVKDDAIHWAHFTKKGKKVEWMCTSGEWWVDFKAVNPLDEQRTFHGDEGEWDGAKVKTDADLTAYSYSIRVRIGDKDYKLDPELIVDE